MRDRPLKIFFDGGCRPNPGPIAVAAVARGVCRYDSDLGSGDNHEAEWRALLHAVRVASALGASDAIFVGDSLAVLRAASGAVRPRDRRHRDAFQAAIVGFARVRLRHVARAQNLAGIALERLHGRL